MAAGTTPARRACTCMDRSVQKLGAYVLDHPEDVAMRAGSSGKVSAMRRAAALGVIAAGYLSRHPLCNNRFRQARAERPPADLSE